jgi:hypothetical protein
MQNKQRKISHQLSLSFRTLPAIQFFLEHVKRWMLDQVRHEKNPPASQIVRFMLER